MAVFRRKTFEIRYTEDAGSIQVPTEMYHHGTVTANWGSSPMSTDDV